MTHHNWSSGTSPERDIEYAERLRVEALARLEFARLRELEAPERSRLELHPDDDPEPPDRDKGTWLGCLILLLAFVAGGVIGGWLASAG